MRVLAVTVFLSFSLAVLAVPVANAEVTLIEPLEARSRGVDPDVGPVGRSAVDEGGPIKARGRVNTSTGRPKREAEPEAEASNDVVERGKGVPWIPKRDAEPVDDLIERDPGLVRHPGGSPKRGLAPSRGGSYRREAEPIRISGSRGSRREAKAVEQPMKNAGGGPGRRDAAAQPNRIGGGISGGRRDADAETIEARQRMNSSTGRGRRDAIPGFVRPGGGTRPRDAIPRDIRGNDANPRGVRPGNGNNERDVTAETVEARGRFRGVSSPV